MNLNNEVTPVTNNRATLEVWENDNPVIDCLTVVIITDATDPAFMFKMGDGKTDFIHLPYLVGGTVGPQGPSGQSAYVYIAYAQDASGAGFSTTFNSSLPYIAIKSSTVPLTPVASDFSGLWFNYRGDVPDGYITNQMIDSVDASKLTGEVSNIAKGCIAADQIADGAVTSEKIALGSVSEYQMNWATHLLC